MAQRLTRSEFLQLAAIVALTALASGAMPRLFPFLGNIEKRLVDLRLAALAPAEPQHPGIVIVTVTEDTLARLPYRSPLDRGFLAGILRALDGAGVRAVGLDVLFDQPTDPAKDADLGAALRSMRAPVVVAWADQRDGLPKAWFAGKIVLVGSDLPHSDRFSTPLSTAFGETGGPIPGVVIHAHALAQILDARLAPRASLAMEIVLVVVLALVGLFVAIFDAPLVVKTVAVAAAVAALWAGGFALFKFLGVLAPLVTPTQSLILAAGVGHAFVGRRERR
jgi:CHASE2 domain-containing sensor protein